MKNVTRFFLAVLCLAISLSGYSKSFTKEGITYSVISETEKTVAVSQPASGQDPYKGAIKIPGTVQHEGRDYDVVKIDSYAFAEDVENGPHLLESIELNNNITAIEECAFQGCRSLTSISIPNRTKYVGVNAFAYCDKLTQLKLGEYLEEIRDGAFGACTSLGVVNLPSRIKTIGKQSFMYCQTLTSIKFPQSLTTVGDQAFSDCVNLATIDFGNVSSLGSSCFANCTSLAQITLPTSFTTIRPSTFSGCTNLKDITFSSDISVISDNAFNGCSSLVELTLPGTLTEIGESAFGGCSAINRLTFANNSVELRYGSGNFTDSPIERLTLGRTLRYTSTNPGAFSEASRQVNSLKNVEITSTVRSLPKAIFKSCKMLTSLNIAEGLQTIGQSAFDTCEGLIDLTLPSTLVTIENDAFSHCYFLENFTLPSSVKVINAQAFFQCRHITSIDLSNVTEIKSSAFGECDRLAEVTLSASLKSIGANAFSSCKELSTIVFPSSLTSIGAGAFFESGLRDITSEAKVPPTAKSDTWSPEIYEYATLTVPTNSVNNYKSATGWKEFANYAYTEIYAVTVSANAGGRVLLNGSAVASLELAKGSSLTITAEPEAGKVVESASYTMGSTTQSFTTSATISAVTANVSVNVKFGDKPLVQPTSIAFNPNNYLIKPGETASLNVVYTPADAYAPVTYSIVSGSEYVTIDEAGVVSGVRNGTAIIEASTGSLTARATVVVDDGSVQIAPFDASELALYEPYQCTVVGVDGVNASDIEWSSDNSSVSMSQDGVLMFVENPGDNWINAVIKAVLPNGQEATMEISVDMSAKLPYTFTYMSQTYKAVAPYKLAWDNQRREINTDVIVPANILFEGFSYTVVAFELVSYVGSSSFDVTLPATITDVKIDNNFVRNIYCNAVNPPKGSLSLYSDDEHVVYVPAGSVATYQGTRPWSSYTIRAMNADEYNVIVNINDADLGEVTLNGQPSTSLKVAKGEKLTIKAIPFYSDYVVKSASYTMGAETKHFTSSIVIGSVTADVTINVEFGREASSYPVEVYSNNGGNVLLNGTISTGTMVEEGKPLSIKVVPDAGKKVQSASYTMGGEVRTFTTETVIAAVTAAVRIDVVFVDNEGNVNESATATFDFTIPSALNPAQTVNSNNSPVCEVNGVTFVNNGVTLLATGGGTTPRLWAYRDSYQYRIYNGATMVIKTADYKATITKVIFEGATLDALTINGSALGNNSNATYELPTPAASIEVKCVTNGSHKRADISRITVQYTSGSNGIEDVKIDEGPIEVFTLTGLKIADSAEGLAPGIYLIRCGNKVSKITIK